ncbi:MAG: prepilin-type N-terminal cleavage/methylation domain-containing protein [Candidatus Zixiibacteriota bacterium]|nr:MAG: prepilin-type N-terminal cleavage/methylation domain-containing protein [candidate division Zixibacteria bacterium]
MIKISNWTRRYLAGDGFTLIELLIALLITAVLAAAAFQFYITMQQQVVTQQDISDMQQVSRSCLQEIGKAVRMAGYMAHTLPPGTLAYEISGDSLTVNMGCDDPTCPGLVHYVRFFLQEYDGDDYAKVPFRPDGMLIYKLMKETDASIGPEVYADLITSITYTPIGTSELAITLEVQTAKGDESFETNNGFRTFVNTERVTMRNVSL